MLALVIIDTVIVVLLAGLVAGLLRSHTEILKALHDLGARVRDPASKTAAPNGETFRANSRSEEIGGGGGARRGGGGTPPGFGPLVSAGRDSTTAHDLVGLGPGGERVAVAVETTDHYTLLAFLSSGCMTCSALWDALTRPPRHGLPNAVRPVIVTKGPELESPQEVAKRGSDGVAVVMSTKAWEDYEVPGPSFFVLVDGRDNRRVGEGVAGDFDQVADLVRRAMADAHAVRLGETPSVPGNGRDPALDDPSRLDEIDADDTHR